MNHPGHKDEGNIQKTTEQQEGKSFAKESDHTPQERENLLTCESHWTPLPACLNGFSPHVEVCVSLWRTPFSVPCPAVMNQGGFGVLQGTLCSILSFSPLSILGFLGKFSLKSITQCSFSRSVLCSKLSVNQSIFLPLSKALLLSSPPLCCWHLLRLQFCCSAFHSRLTCGTVEWGNLSPSENPTSTYMGKGQTLSRKTTVKITFLRKQTSHCHISQHSYS